MLASRKTTLILASLLAALSLALIALVRKYANPDRYRPEVISYLEAKTGKQIEVGHLGVSWIPLSIRLDNFASKNPKPFPSGYFLKISRVDAVIDAVSLLQRKIVIESITLHDPIINVISDPDGLWNFENQPTRTSPERAPIFSLGVISRVEITGGQLFASALIDPSDRPGPVVLEVHNLGATLKRVDFEAFVGVPSSMVGQGDMTADSLRFGSIQATNVKSQLRLMGKQVFFDGVSVEADGGHAVGDLSFNLAGPNTSFTTNATTQGIDVAHLLAAAFPAARGKMTGTMEGEFKFAGEVEHSFHPLAGIHGTGSLIVRKGELPTLNLNDNVVNLARLRKHGSVAQDPAAFISVSADLNLSHQSISSREINILGYGVDIQCSGSVGVTGGALDYQGLANILTKQGFFTNIAARMSGARLVNGKLSFPIRIAGTLQAPKFSVAD